MNNVGTRLFLKLSMKAANTIATQLYGSFNDVLKSSQNHMCVIEPALHICRLHIVSRMCWWVSKIPTQTEPAYKYRPPQCWRNWVGEIFKLKCSHCTKYFTICKLFLYELETVEKVYTQKLWTPDLIPHIYWVSTNTILILNVCKNVRHAYILFFKSGMSLILLQYTNNEEITNIRV